MRKHSFVIQNLAITCPGSLLSSTTSEDVWPRDQPLLRYKSGPRFRQYRGGCNGKGDECVPCERVQSRAALGRSDPRFKMNQTFPLVRHWDSHLQCEVNVMS